jgi:hypothetical protein
VSAATVGAVPAGRRPATRWAGCCWAWRCRWSWPGWLAGTPATGYWPVPGRCPQPFAELANFTGDTIAEVADQARHDIQRVCDSDRLVVGFLAHTGLSMDDDPSPEREAR